jgi:hypothetical protein
MDPDALRPRRASWLFGRGAERVCVALYVCGWLASSVVWAINWMNDGPAPWGPVYNGAKQFLGGLTPFVHHAAQEWTLFSGVRVSNWFAVDLDACFTVIFAGLILVLGALQWFLLGQLAEWVYLRWGQRPSSVLLSFYALWAAGDLFVWLFA